MHRGILESILTYSLGTNQRTSKIVDYQYDRHQLIFISWQRTEGINGYLLQGCHTLTDIWLRLSDYFPLPLDFLLDFTFRYPVNYLLLHIPYYPRFVLFFLSRWIDDTCELKYHRTVIISIQEVHRKFGRWTSVSPSATKFPHRCARRKIEMLRVGSPTHLLQPSWIWWLNEIYDLFWL